MDKINSQKGFLSLVGLLLTVVVLAALYFIVVGKLVKKPVDAETDRQLKEMTKSTAVPLDTSSKFAVKDSLVQQIEAAQKEQQKRADDATRVTQGTNY